MLTENTHGTGCTLSSAIACHLAAGCSLQDSVKFAKDYITGALKQGLDLGQGNIRILLNSKKDETSFSLIFLCHRRSLCIVGRIQ